LLIQLTILDVFSLDWEFFLNIFKIQGTRKKRNC